MTPLADHLKHAKQLMDKAVEAVKRDFSTVRTGKATTALLDLVRVEAYGNEMPLTQVASVAAPEPKLLTVQPWDKGLLKAVEKGILASDLGLTPANDGNMIRIPIPPLTEERRRQMVKVVHEMAEDHKTAIRNVRRDSNDKLKKALKEKTISEDEEKGGLDEVQKLTDLNVGKIGDLAKHKEDEIMKV